MYLKKRPLLAVFLCLCALAAVAQTEYKEGFIIKSGQQYVYGYVLEDQSPSRYLNCTFKETKDGEPVVFTADDLEGYGFLNQNQFRKKEVETEASRSHVFIEVIEDGKATLYQGLNRIYIERGDSFYELKTDKSKIDSYRSILVSLFSDCKPALKRISTTEIDIRQLASLVRTYNACFDETITAPEKLKKQYTFMIKGEGFTGIDRTMISMKNSTMPFLSNENLKDRTLLTGGINLIIGLEQKENLSFITGLLYNDQRFYLNSNTSKSSTTERNSVHLNYKVLRIPLLLRIGNLDTRSIQPFLKAGIILPLTFNSNSSWKSEHGTNTAVYIDEENFIESFKEPRQWHISAGVGFPVTKKIYAFSEAVFLTGNKTYSRSPITAESVEVKFRTFNFIAGLRLK
jgi:hypothetical protein